MQLSKAKPGDLLVVNQSRGASSDDASGLYGGDGSFVAWLVDKAVYPKWAEGERQVRVEPVTANVATFFVNVSDVVGHYPHAPKSKRPPKIERLLRDWNPAVDVIGGVTK